MFYSLHTPIVHESQVEFSDLVLFYSEQMRDSSHVYLSLIDEFPYLVLLYSGQMHDSTNLCWSLIDDNIFVLYGAMEMMTTNEEYFL